MAIIDFGDFPGVNMQDPETLGADIFSDFPSFDFVSGYGDNQIVEIHSPSNTAFVRAYGNLAYNFDGTPTDDSIVNAIEVFVPGGAYRIVIDGFSVSFPTFENALLGRDLSTLYAGHPLLILGAETNADTLAGGTLNDDIYGYGGQDVLFGNGGNDYLDGGGGKDTMRGGAGNDDYFVGHASDVVRENSGQGIDLVISTIDYRLPANVEDLALLDVGGAIDGIGNGAANYLEGNASGNVLQGLLGNDTQVGLGGNDILEGGAGNDRLTGGSGADVLLGGDGTDLLFWDIADAGVDGGAGTDTLKVGTGNLNLLQVDNTLIENIERISLAGNGLNTLTLSFSDIIDISSSSNSLRVLGEAGDTVNAPNTFVEMETVDGYTRYRSGGATLWVDSDINVV
jgi:Ca2+-binding RTX toxin-like protein